MGIELIEFTELIELIELIELEFQLDELLDRDVANVHFRRHLYVFYISAPLSPKGFRR